MRLNRYLTLIFRGFGKQGYQCRLCTTSVHKSCYEKILVKCSGNDDNNKNQDVRI
jgi:hypothetical protein